jgi:hypothetical protein
MRQHDSTLAEKIVALRRASRIPERFRAAHIRPFCGSYSDKYIRATLANFCEGTGNYDESGSTPRFRRIEKGLYELFSI